MHKCSWQGWWLTAALACRHKPLPSRRELDGLNHIAKDHPSHTGSCRLGDHIVEQELVYEKLPHDIHERFVLLMDPILATGNSAARAIQVRRQLLLPAVSARAAPICAGVLPGLQPRCCHDS